MMEKPRFLLPSAILLALTTIPANAALLVYEGFNGYTTGAGLHTVSPNGNTTGLNSADSYANGSAGNSPTTMTIDNVGGLTLGSLVVSGGAVDFTSSTKVAATLPTATTSSSVIWSSYIIRLNTVSDAGSDGFEVRLNSSTNSTAADAYFRAGADSRGGTGNSGPAVSYDLGVPASGAALATGTIFMILSRFDTGPSGGASLWALSASQFDAYILSGRSDTFLNTPANVTATSTDAQAGTFAFNGGTLEFVSQNTTGSFDEIRFGESALDVTPSIIPEPSSALLLAAAGLAGTLRRRR